MENIQHHCYPPQEQSTITPRLKCEILLGVTRNAKVMSRKQTNSLAVGNITDSPSGEHWTMPCAMNNGVYGDVASRKSLPSKRKRLLSTVCSKPCGQARRMIGRILFWLEQDVVLCLAKTAFCVPTLEFDPICETRWWQCPELFFCFCCVFVFFHWTRTTCCAF